MANDPPTSCPCGREICQRSVTRFSSSHIGQHGGSAHNGSGGCRSCPSSCGRSLDPVSFAEGSRAICCGPIAATVYWFFAGSDTVVKLSVSCARLGTTIGDSSCYPLDTQRFGLVSADSKPDYSANALSSNSHVSAKTFPPSPMKSTIAPGLILPEILKPLRHQGGISRR